MSARNDPLAGAGPLGRVEVLADGVAQFHGFCNVGFVWGRGEVLVVDTSNARLAPRAVAGLREQTPDPVAHVVYTHGHVDHVGGAPSFLADAEQRGHPRPTFWGHEALPARFERYRRPGAGTTRSTAASSSSRPASTPSRRASSRPTAPIATRS